MTPSNEAFPYAAELIHDRELDTVAIALSYTDRHNPARNLLACVAPDLGSNLYRLKAGEHELLLCEPEKLKLRKHTGNFVLWPFPNRVRQKHYTYQGQEYSLKGIHEDPHDASLIHGLVFDRSWDYEQLSADQEGATVTTSVEMTPDSSYFAAYPFASRLALRYTLTSSGITVTYTVQNRGTQTLPHGFALHPYFNRLAGEEGTQVTLPANQVMEADAELLPTGRLLDIRSVMYAQFDLNQPTPIGHLKLDHVYTTLPAPHESRVDYHGLDLSLKIQASEDFTHAVIYAPAHSSFFCLENQTCSTDAINLHARGMQDIAHLLEVQPGAEASGSIRYELEYL